MLQLMSLHWHVIITQRLQFMLKWKCKLLSRVQLFTTLWTVCCCCCLVASVVSDSGVGCHFLLQCMKVKSESEVTQSCLTLRNPMDCSPPGSSVHGIFQARVLAWAAIALVHGILQARILEWVAFPFSRGSSQPRIKPRSYALQVDSLPAKPQGKPKNTGVGSLSLLQGVFPTQELNQGLLHCRWILYQPKNSLC